MKSFAGLDVSQQETQICVVSDDGEVLFEGKCSTEPGEIAKSLKKHASGLVRAVLETGSMSGWLTKELEKAGIPAVCICARQAHGVLKGKPHKSDRNDALMLARMAHANLLTPVYVRSVDAHEKKALVKIRGRLVSTRAAMVNAIRGHLKPFGIRLGKVKASDFERRVLELAADFPHLRAGLDSLLTIRARLSEEIELLDDRLLALAKEDAVCRSLMTLPSVGALAAVTYTSVIDDPGRFKNSAQIANYLGLTPRRYQSGETDYSGRISKTGDTVLRHLLYECANILIAIVKKDCALKRWAMQLQERVGAKKARTAVARKLAVLMYKVWKSGEEFDWNRGLAA